MKQKNPLDHTYLFSLLEQQMRKINTLVASFIVIGSRDSTCILPAGYDDATEAAIFTGAKIAGIALQKDIGTLTQIATMIGGNIEITTDNTIEKHEVVFVDIYSIDSEKHTVLIFQVSRDTTGTFSKLTPLSTEDAEIKVNMTPKVAQFTNGLIASVTTTN